MRLTQFGIVTLPENNGQDVLPIDYRSNLVSLQNGAYDTDGNNSILNATNLTRQAVITQSIQTSFRNLARESNKGRLLLRGEERDDTNYVTFAKIARINLAPNARQYNCEEAIEIQFIQDYPFWLNQADIETFLDDGNQLDDYSWNLDGGNSDTITINATGNSITSDNITIDNTGIVPCYRGYFVIAFQNDYDVEYIEIINNTNGLRLKYNLNISGTGGIGVWTIDWLAKSLLTNTSDLDRTGLEIPNSQTDWFRLEVGENDIQVNLAHLDDTGATVNVYWSRHYIY